MLRDAIKEVIQSARKNINLLVFSGTGAEIRKDMWLAFLRAQEINMPYDEQNVAEVEMYFTQLFQEFRRLRLESRLASENQIVNECLDKIERDFIKIHDSYISRAQQYHYDEPQQQFEPIHFQRGLRL